MEDNYWGGIRELYENNGSISQYAEEIGCHYNKVCSRLQAYKRYLGLVKEFKDSITEFDSLLFIEWIIKNKLSKCIAGIKEAACSIFQESEHTIRSVSAASFWLQCKEDQIKEQLSDKEYCRDKWFSVDQYRHYLKYYRDHGYDIVKGYKADYIKSGLAPTLERKAEIVYRYLFDNAKRNDWCLENGVSIDIIKYYRKVLYDSGYETPKRYDVCNFFNRIAIQLCKHVITFDEIKHKYALSKEMLFLGFNKFRDNLKLWQYKAAFEKVMMELDPVTELLESEQSLDVKWKIIHELKKSGLSIGQWCTKYRVQRQLIKNYEKELVINGFKINNERRIDKMDEITQTGVEPVDEFASGKVKKTRRTFTEEEKVNYVKDFKASGKNKKDWCEEAGLHTSVFARWLKEFDNEILHNHSKQTTEAEKIRIVKEVRESDLTIRDWCNANGYNYHTVSNWLKKYKEKPEEQSGMDRILTPEEIDLLVGGKKSESATGTLELVGSQSINYSMPEGLAKSIVKEAQDSGNAKKWCEDHEYSYDDYLGLIRKLKENGALYMKEHEEKPAAGSVDITINGITVNISSNATPTVIKAVMDSVLARR